MKPIFRLSTAQNDEQNQNDNFQGGRNNCETYFQGGWNNCETYFQGGRLLPGNTNTFSPAEIPLTEGPLIGSKIRFHISDLFLFSMITILFLLHLKHKFQTYATFLPLIIMGLGVRGQGRMKIGNCGKLWSAQEKLIRSLKGIEWEIPVDRDLCSNGNPTA